MVYVALNPETQRTTTTVISAGIHELATSPTLQSKASPTPPRLRTLPNGLKVIHYAPPSGQRPTGLVVIAAGGPGGMGPGSASQVFSPANQSIFSILARRLAEEGLSIMHLTWRNPSRPSMALRSPQRVRECADDYHTAVAALRVASESASSIGLPLVLLAHGPEASAAAMAAAAVHVEQTRKGFHLGPFAGVIAVAPSLRVSDDKYDYRECDTLGCLRSLATVRTPIMLIHGTDDAVSDAEATSLIFAGAKGPKAAVVLQQCDHIMMGRFDQVLVLLLSWVPNMLKRYDVVGDSGGQIVSQESDARLGLGQFIRM